MPWCITFSVYKVLYYAIMNHLQCLQVVKWCHHAGCIKYRVLNDGNRHHLQCVQGVVNDAIFMYHQWQAPMIVNKEFWYFIHFSDKSWDIFRWTKHKDKQRNICLPDVARVTEARLGYVAMNVPKVVTSLISVISVEKVFYPNSLYWPRCVTCERERTRLHFVQKVLP